MLSCMVVRFDGKAVQQTINNQTEPIGVDGDPATVKGGISEAEAIVLQTRKQIDQTGGENVAPIAVDVVEHENKSEDQKAADPMPQLNPEALQAARKDIETTNETEQATEVAQAKQETVGTS
ncbi:hypothetical protein MRB53_040001 [Persea americana]|nr:hypothetical protein MRB53_040001 [Persea americana]